MNDQDRISSYNINTIGDENNRKFKVLYERLKYLKYEKKNVFCELFYFFDCSFVNMIISSPEDGGYYIEDDPEFDDEIDQEYEKFLQEQGGS